MKAKNAVKKANARLIKVNLKIDAKRVARIKAKIAAATDPKRKKALKAQLKA